MKTFRQYLKESVINEAEYNKEWWDSKSDSFKKRYIEKHPNSIYAQKAQRGNSQPTKSTKPTETPFERDRRAERDARRAERDERKEQLDKGYDKKRNIMGLRLANQIGDRNKLSKASKKKYLDMIVKDASHYTSTAGGILASRDDLDLEDIMMLDKADKEIKAKGGESSIDAGLAKNPLLPKKLKDEYLKRCLSSKNEKEHLHYFYRNPNLDKKHIDGLLSDPNITKWDLRSLASNPSLAKHRPDVLNKFAKEFPQEVVENPATPEPVLKKLATQYKNSPSKLEAIASNPNASRELLIDIYNMHEKDSTYTDDYWLGVKDAVMNNPNIKKKKK